MPFKNKTVLLEDDSSTSKFKLAEDLVYEINGRTCVIPKGFETDLFSVPKILRGIFSQVQADNRPAILHDYLLRGCWFDWYDAADIMGEAMCESFPRKTIFYVVGAIKVFGMFRKYPTNAELFEGRKIQCAYVYDNGYRAPFLKDATWIVHPYLTRR